MGCDHSYQKLVNELTLDDLFKIDDNTYMDPITRTVYKSNLEPMKTFQIPGIPLPLLIVSNDDGVLTIRLEEKTKNYGSKLYIESIKKQ